MARESIVLCLSSSADETLWRTALASQDIACAALGASGGIAHALKSDVRAHRTRAPLVDKPRLKGEGITSSALATWVRERLPRLAVVLELPDRTHITERKTLWARDSGIAALIPGVSVASWRESLPPALSRLLEGIGRAIPEPDKLEQFLRVLHRDVAEGGGIDLDWTFATLRRLRRASLDLADLTAAMQDFGGVEVRDRSYRGKSYRACFAGSEAVDWLCRRYRLGIGEAEGIGRNLIDLGVFHHVVDEHGFIDGNFFYRFHDS